MNSSYDTIVVGAGLAGACAAFFRSPLGDVLLIDAAGPAFGASGAAAGLVNPIMGRRARKIWKADEALEALVETLALSGAGHLFSADGVLRPVLSEGPTADFQEAARSYPAETEWIPPGEAAERFPYVNCTHGGLMVRRGGSIVVPELVCTLVKTAQTRWDLQTETAEITGFGSGHGDAYVEAGDGRRWTARRIILALGDGYASFRALARLALHQVKGQILEVSAPPALPPLPCVSGPGYIAPFGTGYVLGTSYEHVFENLEPNPAETRAILDKAIRMVPALKESAVLDIRVGIRVTVPGIRRPMVGPLPEYENVWIFTGLGSRGLLMAPLIATHLNRWLEGSEPVWEECAVRM